VGYVRFTSVALVLGMSMLFPSVGSSQSRGLGIVNGEIRGNTGERVDGGTVKFMLGGGDAIQATADKEGKWKAGGIGKGQWRVLVSAPGYAARIVTLAIERESFGTDPVITVLRRVSKD
jgi:hypothetical protein